jgi:hypothetical protein
VFYRQQCPYDVACKETKGSCVHVAIITSLTQRGGLSTLGYIMKDMI